MSPPARILLVFLDGVGLGADDPHRNPLAAAELPTFRFLGGGVRPVLDGDQFPVTGSVRASARAIDPNLGVDGRPQSGTGQTALLTGANAPAIFGRHFGPWVPTSLHDLLARESLFQRSSEIGVQAAFANCAPGGRSGALSRTARRPGAFPFAALAANIPVRDETSLREGRALVSSITTEIWRRHVDPQAPTVSAAEAGGILAAIALRNRLTVFAHYDTDYVGHRGGLDEAVDAILRVDRFLEGVLTHLDADVLLLVTSDHGNLEDLTTGHTRNPVPLFAFGPAAAYVCERAERLTDLQPVLLGLLENGGPEVGNARNGLDGYLKR